MAIRNTNTIDPAGSSLTISSLRRELQDKTGDARHYLILDCCFAAFALGPYIRQSEATQALVAQLEDQLPLEGTAFLCASGAALPAKIHPGGTMTMFSHALLDVLENGAPGKRRGS